LKSFLGQSSSRSICIPNNLICFAGSRFTCACGTAQAWAIAKGATSVELNVFEFNQKAIAFYEGLGYQTLSRKMSNDLKEHGPAA
jgi:hypothetical protein